MASITIDLRDVPRQEWESVSHLERVLDSLDYFVGSFRAAVALFDFSHAQVRHAIESQKERIIIPKDIREWQFIAARDGAMSIYHIGKVLKEINPILNTCPTIRARTNHDLLRITRKKFLSLFPRFESIRHTSAHAAEYIADMTGKHAITGPVSHSIIRAGPGAKITIAGVLNDREFLSTFEGKLQSYEISDRTIAKLTKITQEFYSAFPIYKFPT
ncbi:MAG: hypothetical protein ACLPKB_28935 [Xanthobacteraceae bacterium]